MHVFLVVIMNILKPNTNFLKRSFSYRTAQGWNKLPNSITENVDESY